MKSYLMAATAALLILWFVATSAQLAWVALEAFTGMAVMEDLGSTVRANALWALAWVGVYALVAWGARRWGGAEAFGQWPVVVVALAGAATAWWRLRGSWGFAGGFGWVAAEAVLVLIGYVVFERVLQGLQGRRP